MMAHDCDDSGQEGQVKRRSKRTSFSRRTVVHLWPRGEKPATCTVSLCDFSPTGIGLFCAHPMERGQQFSMHVATANGPARDLLYSVAYCRKSSQGLFRIGAEFICIADPAEPAASQEQAVIERIRKAMLH
jgi:hypothetical protein